jgi:hypothetical protein
MLSDQTKLERAARSLKEMESIHTEFMDFVASLETPSVVGGEVKSNKVAGTLIANCLSIQLVAEHRFLAEDGTFNAVEYPFVHSVGEESSVIWTLQLKDERSGPALFAADTGSRLGDFKNQYLASRLIPLLADALLRSNAFKPLSTRK